ncbi:MAG: hypothetical protein NTZ05_16665 [Chloroflexi bacterium]|nr:hypothetical protein [Chloroflexota bacterium]
MASEAKIGGGVRYTYCHVCKDARRFDRTGLHRQFVCSVCGSLSVDTRRGRFGWETKIYASLDSLKRERERAEAAEARAALLLEIINTELVPHHVVYIGEQVAIRICHGDSDRMPPEYIAKLAECDRCLLETGHPEVGSLPNWPEHHGYCCSQPVSPAVLERIAERQRRSEQPASEEGSQHAE